MNTTDEILASLDSQGKQLSAIAAVVQAKKDTDAKLDDIAAMVKANADKLTALLA